MNKPNVVWTGPIDCCDLCANKIFKEFIDDNTTFGGWAIMCPDCYTDYGRGLGTGKGQLYN